MRELPRKRIAAGVVLRDGAGRVLLLQTSYKANWEVPGGVVEEGESPWAAAAARELREEVGLSRPHGRLLVVDHVAEHRHEGVVRPEGVAMLFDGGLITPEQVAGLVFGDGEIVAARLCPLDEAEPLVRPMMAARLRAALEAVAEGVVALCEQGRRVG
ncbi:8-oxo-dGTP pyrophosphatase MutT, NUDIX family [Actinosynnema pretiosum]|nr:8-oxo-dGTP pyrophosphatase MutT, NUDIX family [Actinosynnema pretiosum]